jgi:hypothetical protein
MSRFDIVGNLPHIPKRYIKQTCRPFFEISAHSAFFGLSQRIGGFQETFDTFYSIFKPIVTENKSAENFVSFEFDTMCQMYEFLAKYFFLLTWIFIAAFDRILLVFMFFF